MKVERLSLLGEEVVPPLALPPPVAVNLALVPVALIALEGNFLRFSLVTRVWLPLALYYMSLEVPGCGE